MYAWLLVGADGWVLMGYQEGRTLLWWAASKGRTEVMADRHLMEMCKFLWKMVLLATSKCQSLRYSTAT